MICIRTDDGSATGAGGSFWRWKDSKGFGVPEEEKNILNLLNAQLSIIDL
jgi:hypothetical protein